MSSSQEKRKRTVNRIAKSTPFGVMEVVLMAFEFILLGAILLIIVHQLQKWFLSQHVGHLFKPLSHTERFECVPGAREDMDWNNLLEGTICVVAHDILPAIFNFITELGVTIFILIWMGKRYLSGFIPHEDNSKEREKVIKEWPSVKPWPPWFGLTRPVKLSAVAWVTILLSCVSLFVVIILDKRSQTGSDDTHKSILGFENYLNSADPGWSIHYSRVFKMLIFTPFLEEFAFRGIALYMFLRRDHSAITSILLSNTIFGVLHLTNALGSSFSIYYILLQIPLAIEIGVFYSLRFSVTQSLWEPIMLHIINNVISSFLPASASSEFTSPIIASSLVFSAFSYGVLIIVSWRQAQLQPGFSARTKSKKE